MVHNQQIKQLTQIEHVLARPSMYCGSVVAEEYSEFSLINDEFKMTERTYISGLLKLFNEIIDNSIDEFVRTSGKYATKISVKMTKDSFECIDNGRGIPNTKMMTLNNEEKYQAEVAFTQMLSGANYENDNEATLGTNGIGTKLSFIFSKKSVIVNDDGKLRVTVQTKNNLSDVQIKEDESKAQGISVKIWPDLEYFEISEIDEQHFNVIKERLQHLSIAYPDINFVFNSKSLKINPKKYFAMFNTNEILTLNDNVQIAVGPSSSDQFEHFSLVNGLLTKSGGTHMDYLTLQIITPIREKLAKKFKTIKPADIKSKLRVIIIFKNFMNARYTSQTKEQITNSGAEISSYLGDLSGLEKFVQKIQRNDEIMLPITELFLLREQSKENAKLKQLNKQKKIKSEKYLPAIKHKKVLFLCEGDSAVGGTMPALGRDEYGFYAMRGVPLNAYEVTQSKFMANKELSEIYSIVQNEGYQYIAVASDSDADGQHIKGLLLGFFAKYLPEYLENSRFGEFVTPVQAVIKNKQIQRWVYSTNDALNLKSGESGKYFKGLGSWKEKDLEHVIKTDGTLKMLKMFTLDDKEVMDDWLSGSKADKRKEYLRDNYFDITSI